MATLISVALAIAYAGSVIGTLVAAFCFHSLLKQARVNLDLSARNRAFDLLKYAPCTVVLSLVALLGCINANPPGLLVFGGLVLALAPWSVVLFADLGRQPTPPGTPADYDRIAATFPVVMPFGTDEDYEVGAEFFLSHADLDQVAYKVGNEEKRLTVYAWDFLHKVQDAVWSYKRKFPRLMMGQEWYDARKQQIADIERAVNAAVELRDSRQLSNDGAAELLDRVNAPLFGLDHLKRVLEGGVQVAGMRRSMDEHTVGEMERRLTRMLANAQQALLLYQAEASVS